MQTSNLKEYLKRYQSNNEEEKKKKKKKKVKNHGPGVMVVDEDPVWQKPVKLDEEEDNDSADEEKPQIDEDIEVKRMKRLEQLRLRRHHNAIAEDGSGWVSVSSNQGNTDQNSDVSPPRRPRTRNDTPSPERRPLDAGNDVDLSHPRQQRRRHYSPSPEPDSKLKNAGDPQSDLPPPRKRRARADTPSPDPPRARAGPQSDLSPPRRRRARADTPSPDPPRAQADPQSDLSPPRKRRARADTPSPDPIVKSSRKTAGLSHDLSPARKSRTDVSKSVGSLDLSPPRKRRDESGKSVGSPDFSPPRKSRNEVGKPVGPADLSPPRKSSGKSGLKASLSEKPKTGLVTGRDIQEEISKSKKNELLRFEQMDPSISGRGAEAVYRDKKGQRISKEEYLKLKQKVEDKPKEKKLEWGKGLAQKREAEAKLQELSAEKEKPFARTRDDPELDSMLKERVRWGDPFAHLVKNIEPVLPNLGDNEKVKESGFIVPQEIPNHSWLKRGLDAAPNRYGIRPGRHWDGVDRSNGFEKKMFLRMNEKRATEREAYLWSVSDM